MTTHRRIVSLGLAAAFVVAGGTAWAVTQVDDSGPDRPTVAPLPTSGKVAEGKVPSGGSYTVSRLDPAAFNADPTQWFCAELATPVSATRGCDPVPDEDGSFDGKPLRPAYALLGTDRFFSLIAPQGVTAMEVRIHGQSEATAARSIDAGPAGELLLAVVGGPQVTSRDPATSRAYQVRLLGPNGETVREIAVSDPGQAD